MSDDYQKVDIEALQGNFRKMTKPMYTDSPEKLDLNQLPTLQKMLDKMYFDLIEKRTEVEIMEQQVIALNCAISALEKVKSDK
tara:strand:- start:188 stop:436 length:249 start_codon:yes stop_codon:yes gene_type:complete